MVNVAKKKQQEGEPLAEVFAREAEGAETEVGGLDLGPPEGDGEPAEPEYRAPTPTASDRKNAAAVLSGLRNSDILGADAAVSGLIAIMDVHPDFTMVDEWPGREGEEYHEARLIDRIAEILLKGCPHLTISHRDVVFLWRNKEKWVQGGKTVRGNVKAFPARVRHLLSGKLACVEINFHHFRTLNPLQRVFTLYHELRQLDPAGAIRKPEFSGFYDELEVFGFRTFRDTMRLAEVIEVGAQISHPFQLTLFEEE